MIAYHCGVKVIWEPHTHTSRCTTPSKFSGNQEAIPSLAIPSHNLPSQKTFLFFISLHWSAAVLQVPCHRRGKNRWSALLSSFLSFILPFFFLPSLSQLPHKANQARRMLVHGGGKRGEMDKSLPFSTVSFLCSFGLQLMDGWHDCGSL